MMDHEHNFHYTKKPTISNMSNVATSIRPTQSFPEQVYNQASEFGVDVTRIKLIFTTIVCVILFSTGLYFMFKSRKASIAVNATINSVKCVQSSQMPGNLFYCNLMVQYTYKNQSYAGSVQTTGDTLYQNGETVKICIDPKNYANILSVCGIKPNFKLIGLVLMGMSLIIAVAGYVVFRLTKKYKFAAAATAVTTFI